MTRRLTIALTQNPFTRPVLDGRVGVAGVELQPLTFHPSELFWRQLRFAEFDVFEASLATCLRLASLGDDRFVALPVFTTRTLCHLSIVVSGRSGIERPEDLRGRTIGVPEYQQTSAVWSRGVLQHEFGIAPSEIHWVMERGSDRSHGSATAFRPPEGVEVTEMAADESIGSMLVDGRLDGSLLYLSEKNLVDRSPAKSHDELRVRTLFDPATERDRYLGAGTGLHATHCVAIRRELAEELPWLALNTVTAFAAAKALVIEGLRTTAEPWRLAAPALTEEVDRVVDPAPYGVAANRPMLDLLRGYAYEQGIATREVALDELFAPQTLDL